MELFLHVAAFCHRRETEWKPVSTWRMRQKVEVGSQWHTDAHNAKVGDNAP